MACVSRVRNIDMTTTFDVAEYDVVEELNEYIALYFMDWTCINGDWYDADGDLQKKGRVPYFDTSFKAMERLLEEIAMRCLDMRISSTSEEVEPFDFKTGYEVDILDDGEVVAVGTSEFLCTAVAYAVEGYIDHQKSMKAAVSNETDSN